MSTPYGLKEANTRYSEETGGLIEGWIANNEIIISGIVGPDPNAFHSRPYQHQMIPII